MRVVVVGGGLGGAACAVRLAKLGHEVTLVEQLDRVGGAVGFVEQDGYRWDSGPTSTMLPAVMRDLFRKSGRPLERELDLVQLELVREHRFEDGTVLPLPSGSHAAQRASVENLLGAGAGGAWGDYVQSFTGAWDLVRRGYLERPYLPEQLDRDTTALLSTRRSLHGVARRAFRRDERLRGMALTHAVLGGHDPRNMPAWLGILDYVEQKFGTWTVDGGMGLLADAMAARLAQRRVEVLLGTAVRDLVVRDGRVVAVDTSAGQLDADVAVCAVDPRRLPALEPFVRRTLPAIPPSVCHLGLDGEVPDLAHEVVVHGDPTIVVRTGGSAPAGGAAWTLLGRGRLSEDIVTALARRGIDVREQIRTRVDRSPREQVVAFGGSPYGVQWQGRGTLRHKLAGRTPVEGAYCVGAHAGAWPALPFALLPAAQVAELLGKA
jgi:phytoene dehydrogenase-like protein